MVSVSIVVIAERTQHGGAERRLQAQQATVNEQQQPSTESRKHTICNALATVVSAAADSADSADSAGAADSTDSADEADSADSANATAAGAAAAGAAGAAGAADEWGDVMSEVSQHQQGDDLPSAG
jgi:hypothetical protein